jgi:hypothetical protein
MISVASPFDVRSSEGLAAKFMGELSDAVFRVSKV